MALEGLEGLGRLADRGGERRSEPESRPRADANFFFAVKGKPIKQ